MNKKTLIIASAIVLILIVAISVWTITRSEDNPRGELGISGGLPFGSGDGLTNSFEIEDESSNSADGDSLGEQEIPTREIFRLSSSPTAGFIVFDRGDEAVVRYVERSTGHIYEAVLPTGTSTPLVRTKITNETRPKVYEAIFRPDGDAVLVRTLQPGSDTVENTSLLLTPPASASTSELYNISTTLLRGNLGSVDVQGNNLIYALRDSGTVASAPFSASPVRTIYSSEFKDWMVVPSGSNILLQTKPATGVSGYAYTVNQSGGALNKILGPLDSLLALPNQTGERVAYSYNEGGLKTEAINTRTGAVTRVMPVTLTDKCAWGKSSTNLLFCGVPQDIIDANDLEGWYRGQLSFIDTFWSFNVDSEMAQAISEPHSNYELYLDVIDPQVSPDDNYFIFINKIDYSLWALKIE